ncbi:MAG TPA: hypothetical protein VGH89_26085 [Pseudonocardia sp.]|jgi:hypothetical protein
MGAADLPAPPADFVVDQTGQAIFTYAQIIPVTVCLVIALRQVRRHREPAMLLCLLGGLAAGLVEPVLDVSTNVWLGSPAQGQWSAFDTLGHPFPLWTLGSYTWYVGGQGFLVYHLLSTRGLARGRQVLWLCFGLSIVTDFVLEEPGMALGVYQYYGPQALKPWHLPLFWLAANSAIPVVLGVVLHRLRPRLTRWKTLLIVPTVPIVAGGVWGATLFPVANAQNTATPLPMTIIQLAGLATVALAVLCVWLVSQVLPPSDLTVDRPAITHRTPSRRP